MHIVTVAEFDASLPDSVVAPQQRKPVIDEMLNDVPLPAGVDATTRADQTIYSDRLTLATNVAQLAVCGWLDQWFTTGHTDPVRRDEALDALGCSHDWVLFVDIEPRRSDYPTAVWETIDTLRAGGTVASGNRPVPITRSNAASSPRVHLVTRPRSTATRRRL